MTTTKTFQRGDRLFHLSPITGKLSPCEVVGRDRTGKQSGWSIRLLTTGLGKWAEEAELFTGWEADLPPDFWSAENYTTWQHGLIKTEVVEDTGKLENLDPAMDYGETDAYVGGSVYGYWRPADEEDTWEPDDAYYSDLAAEWEAREAASTEQLELFPTLDRVGV